MDRTLTNPSIFNKSSIKGIKKYNKAAIANEKINIKTSPCAAVFPACLKLDSPTLLATIIPVPTPKPMPIPNAKNNNCSPMPTAAIASEPNLLT